LPPSKNNKNTVVHTPVIFATKRPVGPGLSKTLSGCTQDCNRGVESQTTLKEGFLKKGLLCL
jgi:hypothetical protein